MRGGPNEVRVVRHTGKYRKLWNWLTKQEADVIHLTFAEVEGILGFPLPPSSRRHVAHCYGYRGSAVARAIYDAGFTARNANLERESVEFHRR